MQIVGTVYRLDSKDTEICMCLVPAQFCFVKCFEAKLKLQMQKPWLQRTDSCQPTETVGQEGRLRQQDSCQEDLMGHLLNSQST